MLVLTGPQRKFAEGIVSGLSAVDAYAAAYPEAAPNSVAANAYRLMENDGVTAEIAAMRKRADEIAGSAVLSLAEKRAFTARRVRLNLATIDLEKDGDLIDSIERIEGTDGAPGVLKIRIGDKLSAIKVDNDMAGEGSEAGANDALAGLLQRVMK